MPWKFLAPICVACVALAACGGGDAPTGGGNAPAGGGSGGSDPGVILRGGERLGWDQPGPSAQAVRSYSYPLYVDGVASLMANVTCATTSSAAGYECSGRLPTMAAGRHTIQLAAVANGLESSRSAPLTVTMSTGASAGSAVSALGDFTPGLAPICLSAAGAECYRAEVVAAGLDGVTSLESAGDDRMLFIEGERSVRAIDRNGLLESPAFALDSPDFRLVSLAVPPDFASSHNVFVSWSEPSSIDGQRELSITRYRELQGTLGQGATIVTGIPIPSDGSAPMAFDDQGSLYLAVPADGAVGASGRAASAYSNSILRFAPDGTVPPGNPQVSPVIASGYGRPTSLVWDSAGGYMWLAGADAQSPTPVAVLPSRAARGTPWPWQPAGVGLDGDQRPTESSPRLTVTGESSPRLTVTGDGAQSRPRRVWFVAAPGMTYRASVQSDDRRLQMSPVVFGAIPNVSMVVTGPDASLILVSEPDPASRVTDLWKLTPMRSAVPRTR